MSTSTLPTTPGGDGHQCHFRDRRPRLPRPLPEAPGSSLYGWGHAMSPFMSSSPHPQMAGGSRNNGINSSTPFKKFLSESHGECHCGGSSVFIGTLTTPHACSSELKCWRHELPGPLYAHFMGLDTDSISLNVMET